jgi:isopenicillin-N epimerase
MTFLKEYFLLDPEVVFLNHASFGAIPKPVFEAYQNWQKRLELQPVLFLGREYNSLMYESRLALGKYLNANPEDLVYIPNATHGVNIIAHSLNLQPDDEVLTTDHEYGACDYTWDFVCKKSGAVYVHQPIPLPVNSEEDIVEQFLDGITPQTRIVYLSHITSSTALRLPVEQICPLWMQPIRQDKCLSTYNNWTRMLSLAIVISGCSPQKVLRFSTSGVSINIGLSR